MANTEKPSSNYHQSNESAIILIQNKFREYYINKLINQNSTLKTEPDTMKYEDINKICYNRILNKITTNTKYSKITSSILDNCTQWMSLVKETGITVF